MISEIISDIKNLTSLEYAPSVVYQMDCIEGMKNYHDNYFDLAVVDPPYGGGADNFQNGTHKTRSKNDGHNSGPGASTATRLKKNRLNQGSGKLRNRILNKSNTSWDISPSPDYFNELFRVSKNQIIWGGNYFDLPPTRCIICWNKLQPWDNFSQWEMAWTSFDKPAFMITLSNRGGNNKENKIHPTQKPVKLYEILFDKYAENRMRILDTHLGSGSSRIAANKAGLDFTGFEIDKDYFNDSETRFKNFVAQARLF